MEKCQKVVVTGFLLHRGKVLIIRRGLHERFLPGYFELPGGKVEFGEDPKDALAREFKEEVGLSVKVGHPYRTFSYISDGGKRHTVEVLYVVKLQGPENIMLGEDHDQYAWIEQRELSKYNISSEILESIKEGFKITERK